MLAELRNRTCCFLCLKRGDLTRLTLTRAGDAVADANGLGLVHFFGGPGAEALVSGVL